MNSADSLLQKIKRRLRLIISAGNKYECPFCGYRSRELSPTGESFEVLVTKKVVGGGLRKSGCYRCGSSDRERLTWFFIRDHLRIFEEGSNFEVLHIAPERNLYNKLRSDPHIKYTCGDKFTEGYHYPAGVQNLDILNLPFHDNSFDLLICNHVLEHIIPDLQAMKELYRVLRKGGKAILQVPLSLNSEKTEEDFSVSTNEERERRYGQFDHVRLYGQDYPLRLEAAGFHVKKINISGLAEYRKAGLNPLEDIFLGIKQ